MRPVARRGWTGLMMNVICKSGMIHGVGAPCTVQANATTNDKRLTMNDKR